MTEIPASKPAAAQLARFAGIAFLAAIIVLWLSGSIGHLGARLSGTIAEVTGWQLGSDYRAVRNALELRAQWVAFALFLVAAVLGVLKPPRLRSAWPLLWLVPWSIIVFAHGVPLSVPTLVFPFAVAAWVLARPRPELLYGVLAWLGLLTAAGSILLGIGSSNLGFMQGEWAAEQASKAILGDQILSGIYSHSNTLGIILVLVLPFAMIHFGWALRTISVAMILVALLWSASRISIATGVAVVLVGLACLLPWKRLGRVLLGAVIGAATLVALALPLAPVAPDFLTWRGSHWQRSFEVLMDQIWLGPGMYAFRIDGVQTEATRIGAPHAHNLFLSLLVAGGVAAFLSFLVLYLLSARNALVAYRTSAMPLLFLAAFALIGIAEDPIVFFSASEQSFVVFPMLALLLGLRRQPSSSETSAGNSRPPLDDSMGGFPSAE